MLADSPKQEVPALSFPYEADTILHLKRKGVVTMGSVGKRASRLLNTFQALVRLRSGTTLGSKPLWAVMVEWLGGRALTLNSWPRAIPLGGSQLLVTLVDRGNTK